MSRRDRSEHLSLDEIHDKISSEMAQELSLRSIIRDRMSYFLDNNYTSEQIESELIVNDLASGADFAERHANQRRTGGSGSNVTLGRRSARLSKWCLLANRLTLITEATRFTF